MSPSQPGRSRRTRQAGGKSLPSLKTFKNQVETEGSMVYSEVQFKSESSHCPLMYESMPVDPANSSVCYF